MPPTTLTLESATVPTGGTHLSLNFNSTGGGDLLTSADTTGFTIHSSRYGDLQPAVVRLVEGTQPMSILLYFDVPIFTDDVLSIDVQGATVTDFYGETPQDVLNLPVANNSELPPAPVGAVEWEYANQQDVEDIMGDMNLLWAGNQESSNGLAALNTGRLLRAGKWADAVINLSLKDVHTTPIPVPRSDNDVEVLGDINVQLVIATLSFWRVIQRLGQDDTDRQALSSLLRDNAQDALDEIASGILPLDSPMLVSYKAPQFNDTARNISGLPMYPTLWQEMGWVSGLFPATPWLGGWHA